MSLLFMPSAGTVAQMISLICGGTLAVLAHRKSEQIQLKGIFRWFGTKNLFKIFRSSCEIGLFPGNGTYIMNALC